MSAVGFRHPFKRPFSPPAPGNTHTQALKMSMDFRLLVARAGAMASLDFMSLLVGGGTAQLLQPLWQRPFAQSLSPLAAFSINF